MGILKLVVVAVVVVFDSNERYRTVLVRFIMLYEVVLTF